MNDKNRPTGTGTTVWKLYDAVKDILGNKPATHPPVAIDTSVKSAESQVTHIRIGSKEFENSSSPGVLETEYEGDESSFVEIECEQQMTARRRKRKKKRKLSQKGSVERKHGKEDKYERAISIFERVLYRKDTDVRFLELEENRLKLEERQLELEDRRLKEEQEREAQRRREEREFQQNLFALCSGRIPLYNSHFSAFNNNN